MNTPVPHRDRNERRPPGVTPVGLTQPSSSGDRALAEARTSSRPDPRLVDLLSTNRAGAFSTATQAITPQTTARVKAARRNQRRNHGPPDDDAEHEIAS